MKKFCNVNALVRELAFKPEEKSAEDSSEGRKVHSHAENPTMSS
jgi:hypothetical protein